MTEMFKFNQNVFTELRMFPASFTVVDASDADFRMRKAITANMELVGLGYTFSPADIVRLSRCDDLDHVVTNVKALIGKVGAKPMYADYPTTVMNMDEATFRFHQLLHYMSTYGLEAISGDPVLRGWMPTTSDTEKTESDTTLMEAKVISLVDRNDLFRTVFHKIVSRRERMTDKDLSMIKYILEVGGTDDITGIEIPFKENMMPVFYEVLMSKHSVAEKVDVLHEMCKHTGDVLKCADYSLTRNRYHFKTSQKRTLTRLLESYPINDFRENICISARKSERAELILRYIDFNEYSKNNGHQFNVDELRKGNLKSWMSYVETLLRYPGKYFALQEIAKRPGIAVRMITRLLREKVNQFEIFDALKPNADKLSTQTLVSILNFCDRYIADSTHTEKEQAEKAQLDLIVRSLLSLNLRSKETAIKGKKVYLDMSEYALDMSVIETNNKSSEGGYIRSGIAYKIPDNAKNIRFFVYWNDDRRVDIDLHTTIIDSEGYEIHGGWNSNFRFNDLFAFSGDITHSDAAEYIDIFLEPENGAKRVYTSVNLYNRCNIGTFKNIDTVYIGAMAVDKTGAEVKLYDPKNCFFTHNLTTACSCMYYGYIDIENRCIVFKGKEATQTYNKDDAFKPTFTLQTYLDMLITEQGATLTSKEDADVVIVMGKPSADNEVSLVDNNFFMD